MDTPLQPPDTHHLSADIGWLELGDHVEAGLEIARISPQALEHPDVLEVRWNICAAGKSWDTGLEIARLLLRTAPERVTGWVHGAYSLRRASHGGLDQAWNLLHAAYEKFPREVVIPYNLACYAAQLGRSDEAWDWLHKAMDAAGDVATIKTMALADADLEPLHPRIIQL
jgi:hypothetical protein